MKEWICTIAGIVGGFIATLFGGWDSALATLVVFMGIDFATGLVTAIMGKSKHSKSGALNSKAGWIGLAKKFCILLMVVVGVRSLHQLLSERAAVYCRKHHTDGRTLSAGIQKSN